MHFYGQNIFFMLSYANEVISLHIARISFDKIPKIGFAHHFYTDEYYFSYSNLKKSIEIVYVTSGGIEAELYGQKLLIPEGSIFVLFRHLPISLRSVDGKPQSHCTVQAEFDFSFSLSEDDEFSPKRKSLLLPFVTPPSAETEEIKKSLFSIVSDMGISREENDFSCAIRLLDIMRRLDKIARSSERRESKSSNIIYKVKQYISKNIDKSIALSDIERELNLSSGYINQIFKNNTGMPLGHYINEEKTNMIAALIRKQGLSFKTACANVGISDISYGYRLFKKHMGVTPGEFLSGDMHG